MEWCIKNDKIEILIMEYTWNGMECSWNVHGMCTIASMDSMDSIWNGVQTMIR